VTCILFFMMLVDHSLARELDLRDCNLTEVPDFVMTSESLTSLNLSNNPLEKGAVNSISKLIKSNQKLESLR